MIQQRANDRGFEPRQYGFGDRPAQPTLSNIKIMIPRTDSNPQPAHYKCAALPVIATRE